MKTKAWMMTMLLAAMQPLAASEIYLDINAPAGGNGTKEKPFNNILRAVKAVKRGTTLLIAPGRYHDPIHIRGRRGFTIKALDPENPPVVCGTKPIPSEGWKLVDKDKNIWSRKSPHARVWQFFFKPKAGDTPWRCMVNCRWPNVEYNFDEEYTGTPYEPVEGSFWNMDSTWARLGKGSTWNGVFVNNTEFHDLAKIKQSLTGAVLVEFRCINTGNDITGETILKHEAGSNSFERTKRGGMQGKNRFDEARFHLESHPALLDHPKEWYFESDTNEVSVCLPKGTTPEDYSFEGRVKEFAMTSTASHNYKFEGIHFFGGAFKLDSSQYGNFTNCAFLYSSYNKRMLKVRKGGRINRNLGHASANSTHTGKNNEWINCVFAYSEGCSLYLRSFRNTVRNCLFHNAQFGPTIYGTVSDHKVGGSVLTRNTFHTLGLENVSKNGPSGKVSYNHTYNMMWAGDFSCHQVSQAAQKSTHVHHNWIINANSRNGVRFDGDPAGRNCRVNHVVAMGCGRGFRLKGDRHRIYHLTGIENKPKGDINIAKDKFYGYTEKGHVIKGRRGSNPYHGNEESLVKNIAGQRVDHWPLTPIGDRQGGIWHGGHRDLRLENELRDPYNLDFRPRKNSSLVNAGVLIERINDQVKDGKPDIGAYEHGEANYWIPGRQEKQACTPIPPHQSETVKADADLMWLPCYGFEEERDTHRVYFSLNQQEVIEGSQTALRSEQKNNTFSPGPLVNGAEYFWRVDEVVDGKLIKGKVWSFTPNDVDRGRVAVLSPKIGVNCTNPDNAVGEHKRKGEDAFVIQPDKAEVILQFPIDNMPAGVMLSAHLKMRCLASFRGQVMVLEELSSGDVKWSNRPPVQRRLAMFSARAEFKPKIDLTEYIKEQLALGKKSITLAIHSREKNKVGQIEGMKSEQDRPFIGLVMKENCPPYFSGNTFDLQLAKLGKPYQADLKNYASDMDEEDRANLLYSMERAPSWMKLDPKTGRVTGTPDKVGATMVPVTVSDGKSSSSATMTITVSKD